MKAKTSITVSDSLLKKIDKLPSKPSRSAVIEEALQFYFASLKRRARDLKDLQILNANAGRLNAEALDVLSYQIDS